MLALSALEEAEKPPQAKLLISISLLNLGRLYIKMKDWPQAELALRRSISIEEELIGADSSNAVRSMELLARCCSEQGQDDEAQALLFRVKAARENEYPSKAFPKLNRLSCSVFAKMYKRFRYRLQEADNRSARKLLYRQSLVASEKMPDPNSLHVAQTCIDLATILLADGEYKEAESLFKRAMDIRKNILGPESLFRDTPTVMENYAWALRKTGQSELAERFQSQARIARAQIIESDTT
jgi:tetratricopeptide (TPR) repeat protein